MSVDVCIYQKTGAVTRHVTVCMCLGGARGEVVPDEFQGSTTFAVPELLGTDGDLSYSATTSRSSSSSREKAASFASYSQSAAEIAAAEEAGENETSWAARIAAAAPVARDAVIDDPCVFISQSIQEVVGLDVTRQQVHAMLRLFGFLRQANMEELATVKDMVSSSP
ncbi:unnamed protein product [Protopolystoma xenopodis]|uniref:Uncharacterized protein n=1 Tax=Protopolystoma xenopodis TaxID=117903 RepID=A0A3S5FDM1_9PLAT|nr:unnamed protein product [Protopolystoma xenopodis]